MAQVTQYCSSYSATGMLMSSPANVYADDTSYATYTSSSRNLNQIVGYWNDFGFSIPTGATITQVEVEANCRISALVTSVRYAIHLFKNGTTGVGTETEVSFSATNTDTILKQTETTSLPSVSELNATGDSGLRVEVTCRNGNSGTSRTFSLDYIKITVTYGVDVSVAVPTMESTAASADGAVTVEDGQSQEIPYTADVSAIELSASFAEVTVSTTSSVSIQTDAIELTAASADPSAYGTSSFIVSLESAFAASIESVTGQVVVTTSQIVVVETQNAASATVADSTVTATSSSLVSVDAVELSADILIPTVAIENGGTEPVNYTAEPDTLTAAASMYGAETFTTVSSIVAVSVGSYQDVILNSSPVGYWKFDESSGTQASDSSGNNWNATYSGSPSLGEPGALVEDSNTSVGLNNSKYITVDSTSIPHVGENHTWEGWFYLNTALDGLPHTLIIRRAGLSIDTEVFIFFYTGNTLWWDCGDGQRWDTGYSPPIGEWVHFAAVRTPSSRIMYINGEFENSTSAGNLETCNAYPIRFGAVHDASQYFVNGKLDEFAYYNIALTEEEVREHFNTGKYGNAYASANIPEAQIYTTTSRALEAEPSTSSADMLPAEIVTTGSKEILAEAFTASASAAEPQVISVTSCNISLEYLFEASSLLVSPEITITASKTVDSDIFAASSSMEIPSVEATIVIPLEIDAEQSGARIRIWVVV